MDGDAYEGVAMLSIRPSYWLHYDHHLCFNGVTLEAGSILADYDIPDGATINVLTVDVSRECISPSRALHVTTMEKFGCGCCLYDGGWLVDGRGFCPAASTIVKFARREAFTISNHCRMCFCRRCIGKSRNPTELYSRHPSHHDSCRCVMCRKFERCSRALYLIG